jgi:hypothetical protein
MMDADWRKKLQFTVIVLVVLAALRTAYVFYERNQPSGPAKPATTYSLNLDDYVTPPRIQPYDLKSARKELAGKTVWAKEGNQLPYYPYSVAAHQADFKRKAGVLPPLDKLQVEDVVSQRGPATLTPGQVAVVQKQVLAVVKRAGQPGTYAVAIGTSVGEDFTFTVNDSFFLADPHELYKHWPPDVWKAIDEHQARPGMSELQVSFALGTSAVAGPGDYGNRSMEYTNNGSPVKVTFEKNKAIKVVAGAQ